MSRPQQTQNPLFATPTPALPSKSPAQSKSPPKPAFAFCNLGSGSGGNCSVFKTHTGAMLIDAGFGPRSVQRRLNQAAASLDHIHAICLTHLDQDHFRRSWPKNILKRRIPLFLHRWHFDKLKKLAGGTELFELGLVRDLQTHTQPLPGVNLTTVRLPHDRRGTTGFAIEADGARLGFATDLGSVPPRLIKKFAGVDVLAIESNYDPQLEHQSSRPAFLKDRIMGGRGHLSNLQAFTAAQRIADLSPPGRLRHIVLLHPSRQCNHPTRIRRVWQQDPRFVNRITLTDQRRRTKWVTAPRHDLLTRQQLSLFG